MPRRKNRMRVRPRKKGATTEQQYTTSTGIDVSIATGGPEVCQSSAQELATAKEKEKENELPEDLVNSRLGVEGEDTTPSPPTEDQIDNQQTLEEAIQHAIAES